MSISVEEGKRKRDKRRIPHIGNKARARCELEKDGEDIFWHPVVLHPPSRQFALQQLCRGHESMLAVLDDDYSRDKGVPTLYESKDTVVERLEDGRVLVYPVLPEEVVLRRI